jgi:hypothetical protein
VNCWVAPVEMLGLAGVTAIDDSAMTVSVVLRLTVPYGCVELAVMVVLPDPVARAEARPVAPIVAAAVFDDVQVTSFVRSRVVESE